MQLHYFDRPHKTSLYGETVLWLTYISKTVLWLFYSTPGALTCRPSGVRNKPAKMIVPIRTILRWLPNPFILTVRAENDEGNVQILSLSSSSSSCLLSSVKRSSSLLNWRHLNSEWPKQVLGTRSIDMGDTYAPLLRIIVGAVAVGWLSSGGGNALSAPISVSFEVNCRFLEHRNIICNTFDPRRLFSDPTQRWFKYPNAAEVHLLNQW